MTIAEQERANRRIFREVVARIAAAVTAGDNLAALASSIAEDRGIEARTVYRWVQHTERELERARRRRAAVLLVPLWLGALSALLSLGGWVVGFTSPAGVPWWVILAGGAVVSGAAALRLRGLRERAMRAWVERAQADEST